MDPFQDKMVPSGPHLVPDQRALAEVVARAQPPHFAAERVAEQKFTNMHEEHLGPQVADRHDLNAGHNIAQLNQFIASNN